MLRLALPCLVLALAGAAAPAQDKPWIVKPEWVRAHASFLASDALQGRRSASRDELIAATYVAAQFESYGLKPAPGMKGFVQSVPISLPRLQGSAALSVGGQPVESGLSLLLASSDPVNAPLVLAPSEDPRELPAAAAVLVRGPASLRQWFAAASRKGVKLLIAAESEESRQTHAQMDDRHRVLPADSGLPSVLTVPAALLPQLLAAQGQPLSFRPPPMVEEKLVASNAIGYLPGSDPKAGTLLFSAHVDHLGMRADGTIMHGANDDASGVAAVLELARALSAGKQPRRAILFVAYGAEELNMEGSKYFTEHPPVPLQDIVANIAFEMVGMPDPKLPPNTLMMTGFERSDLGEALKARGFRVTADPYPEQNFFQRSDNYQLALRGIVAHTVSGWATAPTYHQASDDIAHLDLPFMTAVIQSLIEPARWLANGDFTPRWKPGGKPER